MRKQFVVLVGNVGTGKTRKSRELEEKGFEVVRIDDWRHLSPKELMRNFYGTLDRLTKEGKNMVVDGKNHLRKSRDRILGFPNRAGGYTKIAMEFGPGDDKSLQRRLDEPGEFLTDQIVQAHQVTKLEYEPPSKDEGFDDVKKMY